MIRRLLMLLTAWLPVREITHQGQPYIERYYVATLAGWRVYIHRFVASDPDGLHDHPFRFSFSIILAGWYMEQRRDGHHVRSFGNWIGADTFHRIIVPAGAECWTLFVHSRRVKEWGFMRKGVIVPSLDAAERARVVTQYTYDVVGNGDRAHAIWHLIAPTGRELRAERAKARPAVFRHRRAA